MTWGSHVSRSVVHDERQLHKRIRRKEVVGTDADQEQAERGCKAQQSRVAFTDRAVAVIVRIRSQQRHHALHELPDGRLHVLPRTSGDTDGSMDERL